MMRVRTTTTRDPSDNGEVSSMTEHRSHTNTRRLSKTNIILLIFVAIAAFFLWTEHRAHLLGALPYLLLLGCVFMHLFMHRGHGHGGDGEGSDGDKS
jgi:hypothetical protein